MKKQKALQSLSDVRRFFYRADEPTYFVSATPFNLLGIDEWVRHFTFVNYIDCFDGLHPNVLVPKQGTDRVFQSIEEITNWLLEHKEVVDVINSRGRPGKRGRAIFLFFDERTEELCKQLGLELYFPSAELRTHVDSKITTTRICDAAGVPSVPNTMGQVTSWDDLRRLADGAGLGSDLVVQTAYGDSGHTTFFISGKADYTPHAKEIEGEAEVKIMKRVRCRGSALEACVTRHGTIVGPLMTELVGFKELTPYRGGWCGNEVSPEAFSQEVRDYARDSSFRVGEALRDIGYRGYFEVDFLTDLDNGEVYLGEINPRITGASSMTNLASFAHADAPLFLFHLLEFSGIDFHLDVEAINARWADAQNVDTWSQMVIKHTSKSIERITQAPRSGVWEMADDGSVHFVRPQTHRRTVQSENRAFFLRIAGEGDYFYEGADLGILVTPGRLMGKGFRLRRRARAWVDGIRAQYQSLPLDAAAVHEEPRLVESGSFKIL